MVDKFLHSAELDKIKKLAASGGMPGRMHYEEIIKLVFKK